MKFRSPGQSLSGSSSEIHDAAMNAGSSTSSNAFSPESDLKYRNTNILRSAEEAFVHADVSSAITAVGIFVGRDAKMPGGNFCVKKIVGGDGGIDGATTGLAI